MISDVFLWVKENKHNKTKQNNNKNTLFLIEYVLLLYKLSNKIFPIHNVTAGILFFTSFIYDDDDVGVLSPDRTNRQTAM